MYMREFGKKFSIFVEFSSSINKCCCMTQAQHIFVIATAVAIAAPLPLLFLSKALRQIPFEKLNFSCLLFLHLVARANFLIKKAKKILQLSLLSAEALPEILHRFDVIFLYAAHELSASARCWDRYDTNSILHKST